jgi:GT2 family glycosyltransferase
MSRERELTVGIDRAAYFGALARAALERGQSEAKAGRPQSARAWLDRAHRLAPEDGMVAISRAMLLLGQHDPEAARLFAAFAEKHDRREAWYGLVAARYAAGDASGAASAAGRALRTHAADEAYGGLLDLVAAQLDVPGWCGLGADGRLVGSRGAGRWQAAINGGARRAGAAPGMMLPRAWERAATVTITAGGRELLGSPIELASVRRSEGFVAAASDGGLQGWVWHPNDPDRTPVITLSGAGGGALTVLAEDLEVETASAGMLARPRGFRVARASLAGLRGAIAVLGSDGRPPLGSPLDPCAAANAGAAVAGAVASLFPAASGGRAARAANVAVAYASVPAALRGVHRPGAARARGVAVVIPVHRGEALTLACIASVLETVPKGAHVIVVEDASPEPGLVSALLAMARQRRIRLVRRTGNGGFPAAANAGLRAAGARDVVLLNSDTLVPPGWLEGLREAAHAAPDIGSATPLSNEATILSYPKQGGGNPMPDRTELRRLARMAATANPGAVVEIPTGIGFCLYVRHDCLEQVGLFREDVFAQGYGEENDWCLRARHLGWRHVAAAGVFVAHAGGASFGNARVALLERNLAELERLHPGYGALIEEFQAANPLAEMRRRLDRARWRRGRMPAGSVILITHAESGGVRRQVATRAAALRAEGLRPILLRPGPDQSCMVDDESVADAFPGLCYRLPEEMPALVRLLAAERPRHVELHHLLGHHHDVTRLAESLGIDCDIHLHDYFFFCQRIALVGADRRYCGEPDVSGCAACLADAGSNFKETISVPALLTRSAADLAAARRVVAPTQDVATRMRRHFPALRPDVMPWEDDAALTPPPIPRLSRRRHVCVPGAIGVEKGYDVLLACARDAAARDLPLDFTVVGYTIDDTRLLDTGRAFVTGEYTEEEAETLLRAQFADLAFIPSIWPETWCFTLSQAWRAGLRVACFDLGAPAERVRARGWGWILPLGLSASSVNNALLSLAPLAKDATALPHSAHRPPVHMRSA